MNQRIKKIIIKVIIFYISSSFSYSQGEFNNWVFAFGNFLQFGEIIQTKIINIENEINSFRSSISNRQGDLLFYTDGNKIYTKNHEIMENGTNIGGYNNFTGDSSIKAVLHAQGDFGIDRNQSLIINLPNSRYLYYVFTTGPDFQGFNSLYYLMNEEKREHTFHYQKGLRYSIVDMNQNNGLGKVISKNNLINFDNNGQLTAIKHKNGKDIWVITRNRTGDIFYSYLITENGISDVVQSKFETVLPKREYKYGIFGDLNRSIDGKMLVSCFSGHWNDTRHLPTYEYKNLDFRDSVLPYFEIYHFDNKNGKVYNRKVFLKFYENWLGGIHFIFSIQLLNAILSPDNQKLYLTFSGKFKDLGFIQDIFLFQLDLAKDSSEMINSFRYLPLKTNESRTAVHPYSMRIGPDKKIYLTNNYEYNAAYSLSRINKPNETLENCGFEYNAIKLSRPSYTLPNIVLISDYITLSPTSSTICEGEDITIHSNVLSAIPLDSIFWEGPNGFKSQDSMLIFNNAGTDLTGWYKVRAYSNGDSAFDSCFVLVYRKLPPINILPSDSTYICRYGTVNLTIDSIRKDYRFLWSTGDTTSTITVDTPGMYYITVIDSNGCTANDSVKVIRRYIKPEIEIIGNIPACEGDTIVLQTKDKYASYLWSTGDTTEKIIVTSNIRCSVEAIDSNGCWGQSDEVEVLFYKKPKFTLKGTDTSCFNDVLRYEISFTNKDTVIWQVEGGEILSKIATDTIFVHWNEPGLQKIKATAVNSIGCTWSDSILVFVDGELNPRIQPNPAYICDNEPLQISVNQDFKQYLWSTGEKTKSITVTEPGIYSVEVRDELGCSGYDTIEVKTAVKPEFEILGNTEICFGDSSILSVSKDYPEYYWSTGDTTKSIIVTQAGIYDVEVTDTTNCKNTKSIEVKVIQIDLKGLKNIDFGRIGINTSDTQTLIIKNNNDFDIEIERVTSKIYPEYNITTTPQLPAIISANTELQVSITFTPQELKSYGDSLIITVSKPCQLNQQSELLGTGVAKLLVWLPELTVPIDTNICIPLKARFLSSIETDINSNFEATISYEASSFYPESDFNYIDPNIEISVKGKLANKDNIIANICGKVLLANQDKTDLVIKEFIPANPNIDVETQNGSITIFGCSLDLRRIRKVNFESITLRPNLSDGSAQLDVVLSRKSRITIDLYNNLGQKVRKLTEGTLSQGKHTIGLNFTEPSGVYWIKVFSDNEVSAIPVIVGR